MEQNIIIEDARANWRAEVADLQIQVLRLEADLYRVQERLALTKQVERAWEQMEEQN